MGIPSLKVYRPFRIRVDRCAIALQITFESDDLDRNRSLLYQREMSGSGSCALRDSVYVSDPDGAIIAFVSTRGAKSKRGL
jgi:hypothetical protein